MLPPTMPENVSTPAQSDGVGKSDRLPILDGWRALSILFVMAGHFLPINPILPHGNEAIAAAGMAIFFTLSGFLIVRFLLARPEVEPFLIRRLLRILPLAWMAMLVAWWMDGPTREPDVLIRNMLFVSNLPPAQLFDAGGHLWSLCVEMQFYLGVALLVALGGRRALYILPVIALTVTGLRIAYGVRLDIVTWFRLDEILAGATVALIYSGALGSWLMHWLKRTNFYPAAAIAALCCYALDTPLAYLRPYAVALMVGATLWHAPAWFAGPMRSKVAAYIANISYALYVFHGMLAHTWLGTGDLLAKYLKRPLLIGVTFLLAHISTFYYEQRFISLAHRLTRRPRQPAMQ